METVITICLIMGHFIINGGRKLSGSIAIQGQKNATLPILAATLLTSQECVVERVPRIEDVNRLTDLMLGLGVSCQWVGEHSLKMHAGKLDIKQLDQSIVDRFRASILLAGGLLGRFKELVLAAPGGDQIGARSLRTHLNAFRALNVKILEDTIEIGAKDSGHNLKVYKFDARAASAGRVTLDELSVTATENILLFASQLQGCTELRMAAIEPHVTELCEVLTQMGVQIGGLGTHNLNIRGCANLQGFTHKMSPDLIEIGTFLVAAAVTRGELLLKNIVPAHCDSIFNRARAMGVKLEYDDADLNAEVPLRVIGQKSYQATKIKTLPYPGFPTDLQAPFGVLATQADGASYIHDPMYEGRLRYLDDLGKMGAQTFIADAHRAIIFGPTPLIGQEIQTFDIRAGATLMIAGLVAKGRTILRNSYQIDRGYERIDERLNAVGAAITRVN